jgi:hypothetical protein
MGNWQGVIGTWETDKVWFVHGKLTRCDRYMGNWQYHIEYVIDTWLSLIYYAKVSDIVNICLIDWLIVLYLYPDENRFNKLSVGENVVLRRNYCLRIFDLDFGTFPTVWYFVLWVFMRQTHVPITKWHEQIIPCQFPTITPCQFPCIYHIFNMILSVSHVPITPKHIFTMSDTCA